MRTVDTTLNYLGPMAVPPVFNPIDPTKSTLVLEPHRIRVIDARSIPEPDMIPVKAPAASKIPAISRAAFA